ncbi:MAG: sel1 repeat family protein [Oxalobacter sp.]|nr:sel1 repeat family protein [Oxalobacter sp.]
MSESIKNLLKKAEQGDAQSQFLAGMLYENGLGIAKDANLAQAWYRKAAAQGHREAKQKLGETIKPSEQVTPETQNSQTQTENQYGSHLLWDIDWRYDYSSFTYERVIGDAKAGNAAAQYICGIIAYDADDYYGNREPSMGYGNYDRENISFEWNSKAAKQGHSGAQNNLGWWYKNGHGFLQSNKDYQKALDWFHKATRQGNPYAQYNLGLMYINGQGVLKDYHQAFTLFQDSAGQGNQYAQYNLGLMCANGHGTPQDLQQALDWFHRAAENNRRNQNESRDKALKEAARKKCLEIRKAYKLSPSSRQTASSQPNQNKTLKELLEESGGNHSAADHQRIAQSAYMMARMFLSGTSLDGMPVEKNARTAFEYMQKAAHAGLVEAQHDLYILYSEGIGTVKDDIQAFGWLKKAANKGYPLAMHNLGAYYLNVYYDQERAFRWYHNAAKAGHTQSQVVVALMYLKGTGVPQDMTQAIGWLQKAASQGSKEAMQLLARLVL